MLIETLAFDVSGMTDRQGYCFVESFRLGIAEFPGVAAHARLRIPGTNRYVMVVTWDTEGDLAAFRHSDLYARFLLSPNVQTINDHDELVDASSPVELLAAA